MYLDRLSVISGNGNVTPRRGIPELLNVTSVQSPIQSPVFTQKDNSSELSRNYVTWC